MTMPPGLHNAPAVGHFMRFGAQLRPGGGVDFNLWAPKARTAEVVLGRGVEGEELDRVAAISEPGGWWRVHVADASADTRYQWQIDGALRVPDPAAREAPEGPHGLCKVSQPGGYAWHRADWRGRPWQEMVFYELHVGTFTLAGTYAAAAAELPRLAALGFTAIELMPLATFGGQWGWGYDGVLPFAPHPAYGEPDDLKHFVDAAHALGLCVFLDVVYNHFGPDGNYLHAYAPAFFSATNDSPWGPAINFDAEGSDTVREFFVHNALYWIEEFRMDGLRLDAVHAIVDDGRPHILQAISESVRGLARSTGRHVHLVLENEKNQAGWLVAPEGLGAGYDAQWNDDFHHALHVALTGESHTYYAQFARDPMALLARVLTHGFAFPHGRLATHEDPPLALTAMVHFLGNHDQVGNRAFGERLSALVPEPAAELALLLVLLTPAIPMVFMGDEFGASTPFHYFAHWEGDLRDAVRAGRQNEFSHAPDEEGTLPDPCDADTWAASRLRWEESELPAGRARSALLQRALQVRREWLTPHAEHLAHGGHTAERVGARGLRVVWAYRHGMRWCLEANLGSEPLPAAPPPPAGTAVLAHRWAAEAPGAAPAWAPWSARWTCMTAHT
jgi:maltooligosyltrehalose trehalohydrolase